MQERRPMIPSASFAFGENPWFQTQLGLLSEQEVLAALLSFAAAPGGGPSLQSDRARSLARELIRRFGGLSSIVDAPWLELCAVPGIGPHAPLLLRLIKESTDLCLLDQTQERYGFRDPARLHPFFRRRIGALRHEVFQVAFLDSGYTLLPNGLETLSQGTIDRAVVYPRQVMTAALRREAAILVLAHNHPNGNVRPSPQDETLTRSLVLAAAPLEIQILDHLIVSRRDVFSFRQEGLL